MTTAHKPLPRMVDGHYAYTLSSMEPVSITVRVIHATNDEVDDALRELVGHHGGNAEALTDEWVAANVGEVTTVAGLRPYVRRQLESMYAEMAERSKPDLCVRELASRLEQSVPGEELARARAIVRASMEHDLAQQGLDLAGFLTLSGMSQTALEAMVDQEALSAAEREAALDAFVRGRGITVDETEYPGLLGLSPADVRTMLSDMRAAGREEYVRRAALQAKAVRLLTSECTCSYEHETPEMARARRAQFREVRDRIAAQSDDGPHLKLV